MTEPLSFEWINSVEWPACETCHVTSWEAAGAILAL